MAERCKKCIHGAVCSSANNPKFSALIDTNGCKQFISEDTVFILPTPTKPGTRIVIPDPDSNQKYKYFVDKVIMYRNGSIDIHCNSEVTQGRVVLDPHDFGTEFFINEED